jgi:hypothetical protein
VQIVSLDLMSIYIHWSSARARNGTRIRPSGLDLAAELRGRKGIDWRRVNYNNEPYYASNTECMHLWWYEDMRKSERSLIGYIEARINADIDKLGEANVQCKAGRSRAIQHALGIVPARRLWRIGRESGRALSSCAPVGGLLATQTLEEGVYDLFDARHVHGKRARRRLVA